MSLSSQTHDDGFHEIQLNGKQLVFLFMAATVVSVVIFLCGVLVGRGVRAERAGTSPEAASLGASAETTPGEPGEPGEPGGPGGPGGNVQPAPAVTAAPAGSDPTAAAPPPAVEDLSYFNRLEQSAEPVEELKTPEKPELERAPAARPAAAPPAANAPAQAAEPARPEPPGQGFAVQVAALNVRTEADAIANRLASKGYAAYVQPPANGTAQVYRVRIGKFNTRREAETIAAKLQREEQFKPWITR